ncbi:MAG: hypothetical protein ACXACU_19865, partial [Candidatus Hodarchaeales archaeon]
MAITISFPQTMWYGNQITILIDEILERKSTTEFEAYRDTPGLSKEVLPPLFSGFFSSEGKLGMEINVRALIEECSDLIKQKLSVENIKEEFKATLSEDEQKYLETIQESRKELELMLFYKQKGHRSEQFMFRYNQIILSLDVYNVTKVFSSSDGKILPADPELNPFIGIFETNTERFPILDLSTLVLRSSKRKESIENSFFFQLNFDNKQLLVPVDNIEGIVSIFDEELLPNEEDNLFLEGS